MSCSISVCTNAGSEFVCTSCSVVGTETVGMVSSGRGMGILARLQIVDNFQLTPAAIGAVRCGAAARWMYNYETVPLRFISERAIVNSWPKVSTDKERAMTKLKQVIVSSAAVAAIVFLPLAPAIAGGHGYSYVHPWGVGRGIVGAAVALATLPLAIASAVVSSVQPAAQYPASAPG